MFVDVVRVVGGNDGDTEVLVYIQQTAVYLGQIGNVAVPHEFKVVVTEHLSVPVGGGAGLVHATLGYERRNLPAGAAGHNYQALVVAFENLAVHAGLVVEALEMGHSYELGEVLVAHVVLGENGHVIWAALVGVALVPAAGRDVHLASDDGADALGLGLAIEIYRAVHTTVVGNGQAVHSKLFGASDQGVQPAQAVEHRELGVNVEVAEHDCAPSVGLQTFRRTREKPVVVGTIIPPEPPPIRKVRVFRLRPICV